jgi:phytoene synthase
MSDPARSPAAGRGESSAGSSFHYSFGLLPRDQRRGIESVYAFCRVADDLVDEPGAAGGGARAAEALQFYRDEIGRCFQGTPTLPVTRDLQRTIRAFDIPREPLLAILEGVAMDLSKSRYATFDDLRGYCFRVASAVGLVCLSIFGCRHPRSRDYAIDLGIALQLTNILRDLRADALRGRIYVPLDEIEAFGYGEREMLAGQCNAPFLSLMRHQIVRAHGHFERAAASLPPEERRRLVAAEVMAAIYRGLLRRIEADPARVFERRIAVPRLTQIGVTLRAWVTGHAGS